MADYDSSLPIRTQNDGDVVVKVGDGTTPSQQLAIDSGGRPTVKLSDGTDSLDINADGSLNATIQNGAGGAAVNIQDGGNSITVDASQLDVDDLNATDDAVSAHLKDATGAAFSSSNPLPVSIEESPGTEICAYNTSAAIAKDSTADHDYTVGGGVTFFAEQAFVSGSGKLKVEVKLETAAGAGTYNTKFVAFNSTANPNVEIPMKKLMKQVTGAKVRISITNKDNQAQDLYSNLLGLER